MRGAEKDAPLCRAAVLEDAGLPVPMPDVDHPITDALAEIGWCERGSMGPAPLSSKEIMAWAEGMGESLTPWEFSMIRRMSQAFCDGLQSERAPYQPMVVRMALATAAFNAGRPAP